DSSRRRLRAISGRPAVSGELAPDIDVRDADLLRARTAGTALRTRRRFQPPLSLRRRRAITVARPIAGDADVGRRARYDHRRMEPHAGGLRSISASRALLAMKETF